MPDTDPMNLDFTTPKPESALERLILSGSLTPQQLEAQREGREAYAQRVRSSPCYKWLDEALKNGDESYLQYSMGMHFPDETGK